jgi:hypothetical protein
MRHSVPTSQAAHCHKGRCAINGAIIWWPATVTAKR